MFTFNNTEEEWFCSWVVMRRKFLKSQENVRELIKDLKEFRDLVNSLKIKNTTINEERLELLKSNKFLKSRIKELEEKFNKSPISEAEHRMKMIDEFNKKNNLNGKRKKRKRIYRKK